MELIASEPDPVTKQLLDLMVGSIGRLAQQRIVPALPLDAVYLVKLMKMAFDQKEFIRMTLDGHIEKSWNDIIDEDEAKKRS